MSLRKGICVDGRTADEVFAEASRRLLKRLHVDASEDQKTEALMRVFARYCEIIIERVDALPERNYLAFLQTLRLEPKQPVPARVALTFKAAKGIPGEAPPVVVKEGTQVAAPPLQGNTDPIVFETTREITLTRIVLEKVLAIETSLDRYVDLSSVVSETELPGVSPFSAKNPLPHQLFINHEGLFDASAISDIRLSVEVRSSGERVRPKRELEWFVITSEGHSIQLDVLSDTTEGLSTSGYVVFSGPREWPVASVFGKQGKWLSCRLLTTPSQSGGDNNKIFSDSEVRLSLRLTAHWEPETGPITIGFNNATALDLSSDFLPFGEYPKWGDSFYLKNSMFGVPGTPIELHFKLTDWHSGGKDTFASSGEVSRKHEFKWQIGNGNTWIDLGADDETDSLTQSGIVRFTVPDTTASFVFNGEGGFWIRARLIAGGIRRIESTLIPPMIESIAMTVGPIVADRLITRNGAIFEEPCADSYFLPFYRTADETALYLGFRDPVTGSDSLSKRTIDLFAHFTSRLDQRPCVRNTEVSGSSELRWQYWNGTGWRDSYSLDGSDALRETGIVSLRAAEDIDYWRNSAFGDELLWFRAIFTKDDLDRLSSLSHFGINTVPATHTLTLKREVLGSSNGKPGLKFHTARSPVIGDFELELSEPSPVESNRARPHSLSESQVSWVPWKEVHDLSLSEPADRHFVLNRDLGEVYFGDNIHGRIPPKGINNIRIRKYRIGGGKSGNTGANTVTQLRSSVPYVDAVTNSITSEGGEDAEPISSVKKRGSHRLRHRDRAVTAEDYEDLARMASPSIALAKCYPNRDLSDDQTAKRSTPGTISLAVVPKSIDPKPTADISLLREVHRYLTERCPVDVELIIIGPRYVSVDVEAQIVPESPELGPGLIVASEQALNRFLHPVNGGENGEGWDFGKLPFTSDLYTVLEDLSGIRFIRHLKIRSNSDNLHASKLGDFIICAGTHQIRSEARVDEMMLHEGNRG